jgi:two-component system, sensor histidine kinase
MLTSLLELRIPVNGILGLSDLVLETTLSKEQREYVAIIRNSGSLLLSIIDNVLDLDRMSSGRLEVRPFYIYIFLFYLFIIFF